MIQGNKAKRKDENGAALVVALLVMVICALLGASSILTSNTDIQIAMNEKVYSEAFTNADAGIQWLRSQNLPNMARVDYDLNSLNTSLANIGNTRGIRFQLPERPFMAWKDPTAGNAEVYRVRSQGFDRNGRGLVTIEAEIRVAPGDTIVVGHPKEAGYAGTD